MATRADYRNRLKDKLLGLEDEGYGDFEFTDSELNTYLELAVARLFPAVYRRASYDNVACTTYGTAGLLKADAAMAERVYLVEDATEGAVVLGWEVRPGRIQRLPDYLTTVNLYYTTSYEMPPDDVTDLGLDPLYTPLVVTGALIEALESRHDTGVRPDPTSGHMETQLLDRLMRRYSEAKAELAMVMPGVMV